MQGSFLSSFIGYGQVVLEEKCLLKIYKSAIVLLLALLFNLERVNAMKFHEVLLNLA